MNGPPFFYDYTNLVDANHGSIHAGDTRITNFFQRYLLQKAISVFRWTLPDTWAENFLLYCLYCYGFVAVFETDKFGVIFQPCGLYGYDVYYRPTHAIIANPLIDTQLRPRIGTQCELLRLMPDYGGILDIVTHYAELLAIAVQSAQVNLYNSKLAYVFFSGNKAAQDSFAKLYDQISSGKPAAIIDKALLSDPNTDRKPWELFSQNVGQNYITDKILSDMRKIEAMFDTRIGIPNANTDKKERLVTDEINANNVETATMCEQWLDCIKKGVEKANAMYNLSLAVDWRVNPKTDINDDWKEGADNV